MPASALAIANRRRVTRTSASAFASLRSTTGERSLRIDSAVISLSSNQRGGNHEPDALGIARRQQESSVLTGGIRAHLSVDEPPPHASVHRCVYLPPVTLRGARELPWIVLRPH